MAWTVERQRLEDNLYFKRRMESQMRAGRPETQEDWDFIEMARQEVRKAADELHAYKLAHPGEV